MSLTELEELNPLRYRGYVYDTETSLYYLQSRYYDADLGRFLNPDAFTSTGQGLLGNNMFAYCHNNPTIHYDPNGLWTASISLEFNCSFIFVCSYSIGIAVDGDFQFDLQESYITTGANNNTRGLGDVGYGFGPVIQITDRNSVKDLYGYATCVGGGASVGGDLLSLDATGDVHGFQVWASVGPSAGAHLNRSYTQSVFGDKATQTPSKARSSTTQTKRKTRRTTPQQNSADEQRLFAKLTFKERRLAGR